MPDEKVADVLEEMAPDEAADLLIAPVPGAATISAYPSPSTSPTAMLRPEVIDGANT